ncbi:hypothetical protein [Streptomyces sp. NBC_00286]|nr:hypothetical protein [Streptomyces sp. NBC_00286]
MWLRGLHELRRLHITRKNAAPNHPTICGKAVADNPVRCPHGI